MNDATMPRTGGEVPKPVFATMMMVALVVLGVVSYQRLAIDEYPDVTYPTISVSVTYPGASPEVIMRQVSKPLEEALNTVQGIKEINSSSSQASSNVRVTFNLGVDIVSAQGPQVYKAGVPVELTSRDNGRTIR